MVFGRKVEAGIVRGHKNWHEGGDGRCRQNEIFHFGRFAHKKHANQLIFMVCGEKRQLELSWGHENWQKGHVRNFGRLEGWVLITLQRAYLRMKRTN